MINIEEKRKDFLKKIDKPSHKIYYLGKVLENNRGSGLLKKIKKLIFAPKFYVVYILFRLGLIKFKKYPVRLFFDKKLIINIEDIYNLILAIYSTPDFMDIRLSKFFINDFKADDIFYDIGANYGYYTALASEFCKEVHSFEPVPIIYENLKLSFKDKNNIFLNNVAVSDKNGEAEVMLAGASSSIISEVKEFLSKQKFKDTFKIKTISLESYFKNHNKPTKIKLDVEGAEYYVISGSLKFFRENNLTIAMEVILSDVFGKERLELSNKAVQLLFFCGYKMHSINSEGLLSKTSLEDNLFSRDFDNFIFIKS